MEYVWLGCQVLLLLDTLFLKGNHTFLFVFEKIYKTYLLLETIAQLICLLASIVLLSTLKNFIFYVWISDIIFAVSINIFCSLFARKKYYKRLIEVINSDDLWRTEPCEIRRYILKRYGLLYSVEEIEKVL